MPLNAHSKAALDFKSTSGGTWDVLLTLTFTTFSPHFYGAAKIDSFAGFVTERRRENFICLYNFFFETRAKAKFNLTY